MVVGNGISEPSTVWRRILEFCTSGIAAPAMAFVVCLIVFVASTWTMQNMDTPKLRWIHNKKMNSFKITQKSSYIYLHLGPTSTTHLVLHHLHGSIWTPEDVSAVYEMESALCDSQALSPDVPSSLQDHDNHDMCLGLNSHYFHIVGESSTQK